MCYLTEGESKSEILESDCFKIKQVGEPLHVVRSSHLTFVDADADQVRVHKLGAHGSQDLVFAVLDQTQLARVEDHADIGVLKVVLFVAAAVCPGNLAQQILVQVAEQEGLSRPGYKIVLAAHDLDVFNLVAID